MFEREEMTFYLTSFSIFVSQFGVSSIFTRDAELSGVSSDEGLFVQELVQHVAVRVDNADSSTSQLGGNNIPLDNTSVGK